jgi:hypothetical protein
MQLDRYYRLKYTPNPHDNQLVFNYYVENEDSKHSFNSLVLHQPSDGYYNYYIHRLSTYHNDHGNYISNFNIHELATAIGELKNNDYESCCFGIGYDCFNSFSFNVTKDKITINNFTTTKTIYLVEDLINFLTLIKTTIYEDIDIIACGCIDRYIKTRHENQDSEFKDFEFPDMKKHVMEKHVFEMNLGYRKLFNKKIAPEFNKKYVDYLMKYATI